jgi:hypothetical protein
VDRERTGDGREGLTAVGANRVPLGGHVDREPFRSGGPTAGSYRRVTAVGFDSMNVLSRVRAPTEQKLSYVINRRNNFHLTSVVTDPP